MDNFLRTFFYRSFHWSCHQSVIAIATDRDKVQFAISFCDIFNINLNLTGNLDVNVAGESLPEQRCIWMLLFVGRIRSWSAIIQMFTLFISGGRGADREPLPHRGHLSAGEHTGRFRRSEMFGCTILSKISRDTVNVCERDWNLWRLTINAWWEINHFYFIRNHFCITDVISMDRCSFSTFSTLTELNAQRLTWCRN